MKIQIQIEVLFLLMLVIVIPIFSIYYISSNTDNYLHYVTGREFIDDLGKVVSGTGLTVNTRITAYRHYPYSYPPLSPLIYGGMLAVGLPPVLLDIAIMILLGILLWKIDKKAIPFLFLSFLFVRLLIFGSNDGILLIFTMLCYYFFDRKPILSGVFAGLCPLVKATGFVVLGCFAISILIFKRKEFFKIEGIKLINPFLIALVISLLILSPWYIRNFIVFGGDVLGVLTGTPLSWIQWNQEILQQGTQAIQPERGFIDTSGFYLLPIDILLVLGALFTAFNLIRTRKLEMSTIFAIVFIALFVAAQSIGVLHFMSWRYYIIIFPFLAMEISKAIPEKYLKFAYVICFIILLVWLSSIHNYDFEKDLPGKADAVCIELTQRFDKEPISVKVFQDWYFIYRCSGLNYTSNDTAMWYVDLNKAVVEKINQTVIE